MIVIANFAITLGLHSLTLLVITANGIGAITDLHYCKRYVVIVHIQSFCEIYTYVYYSSELVRK